MRPIDADALLQKWNDIVPRMVRDKDGRIPIDFLVVIHGLGKTPTLTLDDLMPKGQWVAQDETRTRFMCSVCESKNHEGHEKFCPNCGAKNDGGDKNDE